MTAPSPIRPYSRNTRMRHRLWHIDPHCHWCARPTVLGWDNVQQPDLATVDHILSRLAAPNEAHYHSEDNQVLACYECNQRRCREEHVRLFPRKVKVIPKPGDWSDPLLNLRAAFREHGCEAAA